MLKRVIKCAYIDGVIDFIKKNKSLKLFICTGTPNDEINDIVKARKIKNISQEFMVLLKQKN